MFTAYILLCADGTYHFGITKNVEARVSYHANGDNESAYTFARRPVHLVFQKSFSDVRQAIAFEVELKTKSEQEIAQIITGETVIDLDPLITFKASIADGKSIILPTSYIGNLAYLSKLKEHQEVILDVNERFQKQSYRSRCTILSANGLQNLVVPLIRPNGKETLMSDVLISYSESWQKDHIKAIESAYRRAPYFEFYGEDLFLIMQKKHKRLVDLNLELTTLLIASFEIDCTLRFASTNEESSIANKNELFPKTRTNYQTNAYHQVLNKGDFEDNLSALDLLFNSGKGGIAQLM
ncbi:MAG: putative GIY-YIG superfamily endonuclease [Crocinitomix sp.]|jgi:predicted GIY-YIG superfamily endonuclease